MLLHKRGQSTAEYAIVIGLIIAVAAGILSVALKGGIRQRQKQATDYMIGAGYDTLDTKIQENGPNAAKATIFSQEYSQTKVLGGTDYADEAVLEKGGSEKKFQRQATNTTSVNVETIEGQEMQ